MCRYEGLLSLILECLCGPDKEKGENCLGRVECVEDSLFACLQSASPWFRLTSLEYIRSSRYLCLPLIHRLPANLSTRSSPQNSTAQEEHRQNHHDINRRPMEPLHRPGYRQVPHDLLRLGRNARPRMPQPHRQSQPPVRLASPLMHLKPPSLHALNRGSPSAGTGTPPSLPKKSPRPGHARRAPVEERYRASLGEGRSREAGR